MNECFFQYNKTYSLYPYLPLPLSLSPSYLLAVGLECGRILLYRWSPDQDPAGGNDWRSCGQTDVSYPLFCYRYLKAPRWPRVEVQQHKLFVVVSLLKSISKYMKPASTIRGTYCRFKLNFPSSRSDQIFDNIEPAEWLPSQTAGNCLQASGFQHSPN